MATVKRDLSFEKRFTCSWGNVSPLCCTEPILGQSALPYSLNQAFKIHDYTRGNSLIDLQGVLTKAVILGHGPWWLVFGLCNYLPPNQVKRKFALFCNRLAGAPLLMVVQSSSSFKVKAKSKVRRLLSSGESALCQLKNNNIWLNYLCIRETAFSSFTICSWF